MTIKRIGLLFLCVSMFFTGCSRFKSSQIFDGAYLKYKTPSEYLTIKFSKADRKYFEVEISSDNQYFRQENLIQALKKGDKVLVDEFMKRPNGKLIALDEGIGPIWIPENMRREGSQKGNDVIFQGAQTDEIKQWKGIQVYAVSASVFRGAVSGEWYFDVETGFLVGCRTKTIVSDMFSSGEDAPTAILVDTNIRDLLLPGKPKTKQSSYGSNSVGLNGMKIDGIMTSGGEPVVMINGQIYKVGDFVQGKEIVEILDDRIKMFYDQMTEIIRVEK